MNHFSCFPAMRYRGVDNYLVMSLSTTLRYYHKVITVDPFRVLSNNTAEPTLV